MKVEATVDIGGNLTSLLERLAQQIGTTVDKIYPLYVQQAYLEGVTTLVAFAVVLLIAVITLAISLPMAMRDGDSPAGPVALISGVLLCVSLIIGSLESVEAARKIANPNYYAMKMLTADIGRLTGK